MNTRAFRSILFTIAVLVTSSCTPRPVLLEAVRPAQKDQETPQGTLKVYSALETAGNEGPSYYSGYRIYSNDGRLFRNIRSNGSIGIAGDEPAAVALPEGTYFVEAEAEGSLRVKVPVVIEEGRVTVVRLQGHPRQDQDALGCPQYPVADRATSEHRDAERRVSGGAIPPPNP